MSASAAKRALWLVLVVLAPLPYWIFEAGREPAARLAMFATVTTAALAAEPSGIAAIVAGLFLLQTVLYGALLWLLAGLLTARAASSTARLTLVLALTACLLLLASYPVYRTPFLPSGSKATVFGMYF
jgi:hypothetical protein